jgi:hypothetical protein
MDRLARNVEDMLRLVRMNDWGVSVEFIKENISFTAGGDNPWSTGDRFALGGILIN